MNEELIAAKGLTILNHTRETLLEDSTFNIGEGSVVTFSYSSTYAQGLPQIFLGNHFYSGTFLYHGLPVGRGNLINAFYVSKEGGLIEEMSIAENILSLRGNQPFFGYCNPKKSKQLLKLFDAQHKIPFDINTPVSSLREAQVYLVCLIKAVFIKAEIILLGELPEDIHDDETAWILRFLEYYRAKRYTFLHFTRREDSVVKYSDKIYFIHYHHVMNIMFRNEYTPAAFHKMLYENHLRGALHRDSVMNYDKITAEVTFNHIFTDHLDVGICEAEIFGILDIHDSFRQGLFHIFDHSFQDYSILGKRPGNYRDAVQKGLSMISFQDGDALFRELSVEKNLSFQVLKKISRGLIINRSIEQYLTESYKRKINRNSHRENENEYSRDLQILIYRWLMSGPKLMVMNNPLLMDLEDNLFLDFQSTLNEVITKKVSVILLTPFVNTCLKLCDRVLVIKDYDVFRLFDLNKTGKELVEEYLRN